MSEFLAPINYGRAWDVLLKLSAYTEYSQEGASRVQTVLRESYPLLFQKTEAKDFANQALLIEMPGASVTSPLVFVSHLDAQSCKPAPAAETGQPVSAALERAHVVALLEALEALLSEGYRPAGDLIIALSMDGLSGGEGAKSMAAHLKARKISPCFVLDFGGYVTRSAFCTFLPKDAPLALIGISEKGLIQGSLTADKSKLRGRHAGANPLALLLQSGARLSRFARKPALCQSSEQMLLELGKSAPFFQRLLVLKPRLTFPLLRVLWRKRAVMRQFFVSERTVTGIVSRGEAMRAPDTATLTFQQMTLPGETLPRWKHRLRERVKNDDLILETPVELEHSARSGTEGEAWNALETAIEILFDRVVIAPCLSPYITDGRFYTSLKGNVYRFSPFLLTGEEALRGECTITGDSLQTAVQFFRQMLSV